MENNIRNIYQEYTNNIKKKLFEDINNLSIDDIGKGGEFGLINPLEVVIDADDEERYGKCEWCGDILPLSDLRKEETLGYLCNHCIKGIESREGPLSFEK